MIILRCNKCKKDITTDATDTPTKIMINREKDGDYYHLCRKCFGSFKDWIKGAQDD